MNKNLSTERVEDDLWELCKNTAKVATDIFAGTRPESTKTTRDTFVVVSMLTNMKDWEAYGKGVARIAMYAKDTQGGIKNSTALRNMGDKMLEHLPHITEHFFFEYSSESSFSDKSGYHIKAINAYVITLTRE